MFKLKLTKFYCEICDQTTYLQGNTEEHINTHRFVCHFEEQNKIKRDNRELKEANDTIRLDTICKLIELRKEVIKGELEIIKIDTEEAKKVALNLGKTPKWIKNNLSEYKIPKTAIPDKKSVKRISKNGGIGAKNRKYQNKESHAQKRAQTEIFQPATPSDAPSTSTQPSAK